MSESTINADTLSDHVIVCGLGHVGYRLVMPESRLAEGDRVLGISWRRFRNGRADP